MQTVHVGPLTLVRSNDATLEGEVRAETHEGFPEILDLGFFSWKSGRRYATAELDRDKARELRDALTAFLGE